ncbi:transposase [Paraburkholderia terricola]|uniref:transposase n=1 Tax=Paraburkholderia terricola TaxID=169427 RepID=UPI00286BFB80|nr:transposase [Paraburkholderia terricola]
MKSRKPYRSDVSDEELSFAAPCLALVREDGEQRRHDLREVFNALRWLISSGASWRMLPNDSPRGRPYTDRRSDGSAQVASRRWRMTCRNCYGVCGGRKARPSAMILDSRGLQSTPQSGARAGYDGARRRTQRNHSSVMGPTSVK